MGQLAHVSSAQLASSVKKARVSASFVEQANTAGRVQAAALIVHQENIKITGLNFMLSILEAFVYFLLITKM